MGRKRLAPKIDEEPKLGKRVKKEEAVKAEPKKPKKEAEKESKKAKGVVDNQVKPFHHEIEQTPRRGTRL